MGRHRLGNEQKKRGKLFIIFKYTILGFFVIGLCCFIFFFSYLMGLEEWKEFDPNNIAEMQQTLLIYDCNGLETAALYSQENRLYVSIDDIPDYVKNAFIAVEDSRFYEHNGVDFIRIIGSAIADLKNGNLRQGASTISQQLVKNTSLTGERTISRKLQEAVMAFELEQAYTKDEILEMYLNYIPFGNGAYGIEAAAKVYFGTTTDSLTIAQAALLAGVIKAPTYYAPHIDMEKSIERRNLVLSLMFEQGYISEKDLEEAQSEAVVLNEKTEYEYGFFIDLVLSEAEDILLVDSEELLSSGYKIYTSLDQNLQNEVEALFEDSKNFPENAPDGELCQAALCILDSETSEIRAIVGGRSYETRRGLNRAVDMKRQPGSTIKPVLVYAPAMEKLGFTPTTLVLDETGDFDGYIPKNYSNTYSGWVTLRDALSKSLNLPAVRTLEKLGVETAKLYASNVGIPFEEEDTGLTLALGGFTTGVSPMMLCNAFTPFANGGYYSYPSCITKIEDASGDVIYECPDTKVSVLSEETAFLMTSILKSTVETGTARRLYTDGITIAAKTGTSSSDNISGNRDAWTVAYNAEYTICCWMGFDSTDEGHCLDSGVTGGTYPALLIKNIFEELYSEGEAPDFMQPDSIVEVKIDIQSLQNESAPTLASAFTPDDEAIFEYFRDNDVPTEYTSYWVVPSAPDDLSVTNGDGGYPSISFTPKQSFALYRIIRIGLEEGIPQLIGEYSGAASKITVNDYSAEYGHTYEYYIVPVHPEIEIKGELLTGPASGSVSITLLSEENYMP
ncbi:MAG: PBP1A family penicillin-binding protein [Eubacteriales bacterium]|nr:PBP1A family penicillin-binding protein [Eubacteriales bacterium]